MKRTIIFGDIHGCDDEWQMLLDKTGACSDDRLIAVGDLICKGPAVRKTLERALGLKNLTCLTGNHELRFIKQWRKQPGVIPKSYDRAALRDMGARYPEFMQAIAAWPFYLEEEDFIAVHAGVRPEVPLHQQSLEDLTSLRWLDDRQTLPWYESYTGTKPIIFGHWVRETPLIRENAFGLDTGCVYGGALTALILPERRIVQVKARQTYYQRRKA